METKFDDGRERIFKKPEFLKLEDVIGIDVTTDAEGKPWAVFQLSYSWAITPASARLTLRGDSAVVSDIRLKWADDKEFTISDDALKATPVTWIPGIDSAKYVTFPDVTAYAIPLPFMPSAISVS